MTAYERANEFREIVYNDHNKSVRCLEYIDKYDNFYDTFSSGGFSALILACANGLELVAYKLIDRGAKVNIKCSSGHTPLSVAIRYGNMSQPQYTNLIRTLIKNGADVSTIQYEKSILLYALLKFVDREIVMMLIEAGADYVDAFDKIKQIKLTRYNNIDDKYICELIEYIKDRYRKQIILTIDDTSPDNQLFKSFRTTYVSGVINIITNFIL
ncbi:MAG: hypothetical protein Faunusvirus11_18 [Faunusvirus sp.]|jgi:ankyrin repeat protein|uniref:Uncharacterized protein n=1 Tax=Faunusvirus sp. TaxID=2487766 RepID=A0A3G5A1K4_9VIRU|nr:MAG: hypothetical protein Faunusvirus11_18 [Faunusvirus sp.]